MEDKVIMLGGFEFVKRSENPDYEGEARAAQVEAENRKAQKATKFSDEKILQLIRISGDPMMNYEERMYLIHAVPAMIAYNNMIDKRWE